MGEQRHLGVRHLVACACPAAPHQEAEGPASGDEVAYDVSARRQKAVEWVDRDSGARRACLLPCERRGMAPRHGSRAFSHAERPSRYRRRRGDGATVRAVYRGGLDWPPQLSLRPETYWAVRPSVWAAVLDRRRALRGGGDRHGGVRSHRGERPQDGRVGGSRIRARVASVLARAAIAYCGAPSSIISSSP
jgi:hypothetical protein